MASTGKKPILYTSMVIWQWTDDKGRTFRERLFLIRQVPSVQLLRAIRNKIIDENKFYEGTYSTLDTDNDNFSFIIGVRYGAISAETGIYS